MEIQGKNGGWDASAAAWIAAQGEGGDTSRRLILDPLLERVLQDVSGAEILDVGCGEGRYARILAGRGAVVTGIDPVEQFIERARTLHPEGRYLLASGESLPFGDASFDIVISYLSLIDIPDYRSACLEMCRVLRSGGSICLVTISNIASTSDQWFKDANGNKLYRTVDRYMEEFMMDLEWGGIRIRNYHRPMSAILNPFFASGLVIDGFWEPLPGKSSDWYRDEYRAPTFQVIRFAKPPELNGKMQSCDLTVNHTR